jgi:uroporphyrinogen-III synthase
VIIDTEGMPESSLAGFSVGITADRRWEEQAELLRRRDATVLHGATIRTLPMGPADQLRAVTEQLILDPPDLVIANTGIGIRAWFAAADSWGIGEALLGAIGSARIFARGPKASAAIHQMGLDVEAKAQTERMEEVIELAVAAGVNGQLVAFQRHGDDSPSAVTALRDAGAKVIEVPVYRWILPDDLEPAQRLIEATLDGRLQAVTFTSAPAVRNLFLIAQDMGREDALRAAFGAQVVAVAVGPVCAAAAEEHGIRKAVVPEKFRIGPMIRTLTEELVAHGRRSTLCGVPVTVQGRVAQFGPTSISLSEREAGVLTALLNAAPRVVSRPELLGRLWDSTTDAHVVEVTIGRLRKRLAAVGDGSLAAGIVAVHGRGYAVRV